MNVAVVWPSAGADTTPSGMSLDQPLAARKPLTKCEKWPRVVQMGIIDGDQHAGQFTLNPPLVIPVLNEGLLFCPDEVEGDYLPTCTVEVLRAPTWLAFDCVDVRKVSSFSVLANDPEARGTPPGPGIQSPFEVADLTVALGRLSNFVQDGVIPIDERHKVCMVAWVGDALPILVPAQ